MFLKKKLGLPFAQLMSIDRAVKQALEERIHGPAEMYLDESYYHSLKFHHQFHKHNLPKASYLPPMSDDTSIRLVRPSWTICSHWDTDRDERRNVRRSTSVTLLPGQLTARSNWLNSLHLAARGDRASKENLKKGFLVLDISATPLRVRRAPGLSSMGGGSTSPLVQPRVSFARRGSFAPTARTDRPVAAVDGVQLAENENNCVAASTLLPWQ